LTDFPLYPRSLLFTPGDRPDLIAKAAGLGADLMVVDLEDAVAASGKDAARSCAVDAMRGLEPARRRSPILLRINPIGTAWFADDVDAAVEGGFAGVVYPKLEQTSEVECLHDLAGRGNADHLWVIGGLESAFGIAGCRHLVSAVDAVYFGAEDYIAHLGGRRSEAGDEVLYARSEVVLAGRLAGIPTIDQAVVHLRDDARFRADAVRGRALGYRGKICLNPRQVELAREVFTPSKQELANARALLAAGRSGVTVVGGEMIDDVHVRAAEALLARDPRRSDAGATGFDTPL
jgi:citrate lyase subunit beta/citryl-CoA lyase